MKERPILFSAPMVRAILAGTKTQTRRALNERDIQRLGIGGGVVEYAARIAPHIPAGPIVIPQGASRYGEVGDRLWVRETFTHITGNGIRVHYRADGEPIGHDGQPIRTEPGLRRWAPSIHMPRKWSRITLEVAGVRVERLQSITEEDARAEGVEPYTPPRGCISPEQRVPGAGFDLVRLGDQPHRLPFADLWCKINGAESWAANPWVWVVEFKRIEQEPLP